MPWIYLGDEAQRFLGPGELLGCVAVRESDSNATRRSRERDHARHQRSQQGEALLAAPFSRSHSGVRSVACLLESSPELHDEPLSIARRTDEQA